MTIGKLFSGKQGSSPKPGKPIPATKHETRMSNQGPLAKRVEEMKRKNRRGGTS